MNSLIYSTLIIVVAIFHQVMHRLMKKRNAKICFCAIWCIDAIFAVCGTLISFMLYQYIFYPYLTVRNVVLIAVCLLITLALVCAAPSGISLFTKKKTFSEEDILIAEYRLNDTLGMVRNCFFTLLFFLPVLFVLIEDLEILSFLTTWNEGRICGGFCFAAFLFLVPVCLRQTFFWLRNLTDCSLEVEKRILKQYRIQLQYRHKNTFL